MSRYLSITAILLTTVLVTSQAAYAHCDSETGPVATAARQALETGNVNLVLPYVPAEAEAELTAAFERSAVVRSQSVEAQRLADLYFAESAVRLHRAGEGAPYTGLKPAGTDFGPAIPAAEKALESGDLGPVLALLTQDVEAGVTARYKHVSELRGAPEAPATAADVQGARERVKAELAFVGYVEGIHQATRESAHVEGAVAEQCGH